jgi:cyclopropane-fatty-acyl-phospholipid synthase
MVTPTVIEKLSMRYVERVLAKMCEGALVIEYPNNTLRVFGRKCVGAAGHTPKITLHRYDLFYRLLRDGGIALGETFEEGGWSTDDLPGVLKVILNNSHVIEERSFNVLKPVRLLHRFMHWLQRNTLAQAKKNISFHYDLSNEFFKLFLDPSLTYSSAIFASPDQPLEDAQQNKIHTMLQKAALGSNDTLLEIGSGWGTLAIEAARKGAQQVVSLSLSQEQINLARERAAAAQVTDRVEFRYQDYRETTGSFDKIVSVEMMEAVGHENLPAFFATIDRLLKPTGVAVLQVISYPDQWYQDYRKRQDWIQKYIFPGSHLPSLSAMLDAIREHTKLSVEQIDNIGPHYAKTLQLWRQRCEERKADILQLGFDQRFYNRWMYYLASCEAEFATRWLTVYQITLTRPNNQALIRADEGRLYGECAATGVTAPLAV